MKSFLFGGLHFCLSSACSCRCSSVRNVAGAWQFSGISLSRFVNYWRNHGRAALVDVPASAMSFFAVHERPAQGENGAKRQRRHIADSVKTEEESKNQTPPTGEAAVKGVPSERTSEATDVVAASRRGLRRARSISSMSLHVPKQQRRTGAARMGVATGASFRGSARMSEMQAVSRPRRPLHRETVLQSRRIAAYAGGAAKLMGRSRREL